MNAAHRAWLACLIGPLGALPLGCQRPPAAVGDSAGPPGPVAVVPGVERFARVSRELYRGGQPTREGFAQLKGMGIRTVVSLRVTDSDREEMAGLGLRYHRISFKYVHPEDEDVVAFLKIVADPANQPVFVHCREGVDRTGMMVAVYRILVQGWSKRRALAEMKAMGFHRGLLLLKRYVKNLDVAKLRFKLAKGEAPQLEVIP